MYFNLLLITYIYLPTKVDLPDGRVQRVTYTSTKEGGFVADVTYEGTPVYPDPPKGGYGPYQGPGAFIAPPKSAYAPAPKYAPAPAPVEYAPAPAPAKYAPAPVVPKYSS